MGSSTDDERGARSLKFQFGILKRGQHFKLPARRPKKSNKVGCVHVADFFGKRCHGGCHFTGPVWSDGMLIAKKDARMRTLFRNPAAQQIRNGREVVGDKDTIFVPACGEDLVILGAEKCSIAPMRNMLGLNFRSDFT